MTPEPAASPRSASRSRLVCIVPMYNEGGHALRFLQALHAEVAPVFGEVVLLVIDDGSRDATRCEVLQAIELGLPVRYQRLSRNFGKEIALSAGLAAAAQARPDAVLIIDADFQHPFATVHAMVERWQNGIDSVYGVQTSRSHESLPLRQAKRLFYRLMHASDRFTIPSNAGDFRLLDRRVVEALNLLPERNRYMKGMYAWVGFSSAAVPFEALPRSDGQSSFNLWRLIELALDGLTAFTSWPLRMASIMGALVSIGAILYGCWIVLERLLIGQPIPGFATLAASLMFFSGIQLLSIGLLGEYIGRVFVEVKGRPLYLIAEDAGQRPAGAPEQRP